MSLISACTEKMPAAILLTSSLKLQNLQNKAITAIVEIISALKCFCL